MTILRILLGVVLGLCLITSISPASDSTKTTVDMAGQGYEAMEIGPPPQIKESAYLIGKWKFKGEMKMDMKSEDWVPFEATATFSYVCGGAAIQMDYRMPSPQGDMIGLSISAFDREKDEWQDMWVDSWSGQMMMMTGRDEDGKRVMTGKSVWQGKEFLVRNTSWDITETSFKWQMEDSEDGENWVTTMRGEYTKQ